MTKILCVLILRWLKQIWRNWSSTMEQLISGSQSPTMRTWKRGFPEGKYIYVKGSLIMHLYLNHQRKSLKWLLLGYKRWLLEHWTNMLSNSITPMIRLEIILSVCHKFSCKLERRIWQWSFSVLIMCLQDSVL